MVDELEDSRRQEPSLVAGERDMLEGWLEYHRATLLLKVEGLDDFQRRARPVPTSLLSLHGLVRHMAEVERGWFTQVLAGRAEPPIWSSEDNPDADFAPLDDADWDADFATWSREVSESRQICVGRNLDDVGTRDDKSFSLRWIYTHMIEEYARHNGHADLLRELIDGAVGC